MFNIFNGFLEPYSRINEYQNLLERIECLENKIKILEEENIENNNTIYQLMNSIEAVDTRIDILNVERWHRDNV